MANRYPSEYPFNLFSSDPRDQIWHKLWVSLARAEMQMGKPISKEQAPARKLQTEHIDRSLKRVDNFILEIKLVF